MAFGDEITDIDNPGDKSYAEAARKMVAGASATRIGAQYIAEFYRSLTSEGVPDELARDLTKEFAKEIINPKVHAANAGLIDE